MCIERADGVEPPPARRGRKSRKAAGAASRCPVRPSDAARGGAVLDPGWRHCRQDANVTPPPERGVWPGKRLMGAAGDAWRGGQHARGQVRAHRRSGSDFCSSGCRVMVSRTSLRSDAAGSAADSAFSGKCFLQRPDRSTRGHGRQGTSSFGLLQSSKQVCI